MPKMVILTLSRLLQATHHLDKRFLAISGDADNAENLALAHFEAYILE